MKKLIIISLVLIILIGSYLLLDNLDMKENSKKYFDIFSYKEIADKYINIKNKTIEQFNDTQYSLPEKIIIIEHNCNSIENPEWAINKCKTLLSEELSV